jgi:hypothetical protein
VLTAEKGWDYVRGFVDQEKLDELKKKQGKWALHHGFASRGCYGIQGWSFGWGANGSLICNHDTSLQTSSEIHQVIFSLT